MSALETFKSMFVSGSEAEQIGLKLRAIVTSFFPEATESIIGGAKVKLALYSRNGSNNVLCGIQPAAHDTCMLYVHHVDSIDHKHLKFTGKGKHAKRIKFDKSAAVLEPDIKWLLQQVSDNAPY